jgi:hypothetical protein
MTAVSIPEREGVWLFRHKPLPELDFRPLAGCREASRPAPIGQWAYKGFLRVLLHKPELRAGWGADLRDFQGSIEGRVLWWQRATIRDDANAA